MQACPRETLVLTVITFPLVYQPLRRNRDTFPPAAQVKQTPSKRDTLRLAIPSKGRMAEDTQQLLKVHMKSNNACSHARVQRLQQPLLVLSNALRKHSDCCCRIVNWQSTNLTPGSIQLRSLW